MKTFLTYFSIFLFFGLTSTALGQLLEENFDYPVGDNLSDHGWAVHSGSGYPIQVVSPGLTYTGYPGSGIGNAVEVTGGGGSRQDENRSFASQSSGSVYAMFMVDVHTDSAPGDYFFHLGPSTLGTTFRGRVFVKGDSAGMVAFGVSKSSTSLQVYTGFDYAINTTHVIVLKYTFNDGTNTDDEVSLWVDPVLSGSETTPDLTQTDSGPDASDLGTVALRQGGNLYDVTLDGIRISTTWSQPTPSFSVTPSSLDFGELFVGITHADTLTVENLGLVPLHVDSVTSDQTEFTVLPTSAVVLPSGNQEFVVTFAPTSPGVKDGYLTFYHDAAGSPSTVSVTGTALATGITLEPTHISFGDLLIGTMHTDSVTVTNGESDTLKVTSIVSSDPVFTTSPASLTVDPWSKAKFGVTFAPTSTGPKTGSISLFENSTFIDSITVSGTGTSASFAVSASSLDFGSLFVGETHTDTLIVTNSGTSDLDIASLTSSDTNFTVTPTSAVVPSSSSEMFFVTFAPKSSGDKTGMIVFSHNAPHSSADTVSVSGKGLQLLTMAQARALANGTEVTIHGIVTRVLGAYTRLQDSTGGIVLYQSSGAYYDTVVSGYVKAGDMLRITGKTSEFYSLKEIAASDLISFERISRDNPLPTPQLVTLADIAAHGEDYESELITVQGMTIDAAGDATFSAAKTYQIIDPSDNSHAVSLRMSNAGDTYVDGLPIPAVPVTFTGVLGQFSSSDPASGYQLQPIDSSDIQATEGVKDTKGIPTVFALYANYPNPFNPTTRIAFDIPKQTAVTLEVYNMLGQKVTSLINRQTYSPGSYEISFNASHLASGMYMYRIVTPEFTSVKKMLLLK